MFQQSNQSADAAWPADQTVMQPDREQLWGGRAFAIQHVECVTHVDEKLFGCCKARVLVEPVVIGLVGIRNDQVRSAGNEKPIRQLVRQRVPVVQKPSLPTEETTGV